MDDDRTDADAPGGIRTSEFNLARLLERRERLLGAVADTAERLLQHSAWHASVEQCLARLGRAMGASRAYLHQNQYSLHGERGSLRRFEWCADGVAPMRDTDLAGDESYADAGLTVWSEQLGKGEAVRGAVASMDESVRLALAPQGVVEILLVPVFVSGQWWGYLGFDNCGEDLLFASHEQSAAQAVARILGAAVLRRQADEELRASEERYRQLVENARDIVYVHDLKGRFLSINQAGLDLTGYARAEVPDLSLESVIAPAFQEIARQQTLKKIAGEATATTYPLEILTKGGQALPLEVSSSLVFQDGRPVAVQGIARDVSERARLEAQLRQAQKMEAVGRLAGGVAHDFNNILTVITGYADSLIRQLQEDDPLREGLQEIGRAGERAADLTQQLLAFSRRRRMRARLVPINLVVKDLERMLQRVLGEHVDLVTDLQAEAGWVRVDPAQVEQVVVNLALNARDAMPTGGQLSIHTRETAVGGAHDHPMTPGAYVVLAVQDTGCGMDASTLAQVFEPFFTTKEPGKGTGLGLSTAYGIIKQCGGYIWAESEVGQGSRFEIYLPRAERKDSGVFRVPVEVSEAPRAVRGRILLVEDELSLRQMVAGQLREAGFDVQEAQNGEQALEHARAEDAVFDLLLADVVMPGMSGTELARILCQERPALRVLFMSGYSERFLGRVDPEVLKKHPLLPKPFKRGELLDRIGEVLAEPEDRQTSAEASE